MFIIFIIGCIFLGIVLAVLFAPIVMVGNNKKLKDMDDKIEDFESKTFSTSEEKEKAKQQLD